MYMYVKLNWDAKRLLQLWDTDVKRELQNEKFLPTVGFEFGIIRLQSEHNEYCSTKSDTQDKRPLLSQHL